MDGFTRRKEQSKDAIREAALTLFSQFGVEKVSINEIARKAGVSPATIYNNFGSKETLVREFVITAVDQLVHHVEEILTPDKPFAEKMTAVIQFIAGMISEGQPAVADRVVFTGSSDLQSDPEIRKIHETAKEKMTVILLRLVQEGKEQGQIHADFSEEALSIYFQAFMNIFPDPNLQTRFHQDPILIQNLGALMIYGLGGEHHSG